jgi:hypothetical protein
MKAHTLDVFSLLETLVAAQVRVQLCRDAEFPEGTVGGGAFQRLDAETLKTIEHSLDRPIQQTLRVLWFAMNAEAADAIIADSGATERPQRRRRKGGA